MNIIYSADSKWYKHWFRFELLLELTKLGHQVTYIAPQKIEHYFLNMFKNKNQRNVSFDTINYQPFLRLSKKDWAAEQAAIRKIVAKLRNDQTVFISNDYRKCAAMKEFFQQDLFVIYDIYDRYSEYGNEHYSKDPQKIEQFDKAESAAIPNCDLVLCASTTLTTETKQLNDAVLWFPNAVPQEYITHKQNSVPSRTIGMLSDRMSRLDQELLAAIANRIPDYRIELIGKNDLGDQLKLPANVFLKEYMPHHQLLEYITKWDCGFSLYVDDRFNHYCCPMKYFEYSARDLPTITSAIPEAKKLASMYPDIIYLADDADTFIQRLQTIETKIGQFDFSKLAEENNWAVKAMQLVEGINNRRAAQK